MKQIEAWHFLPANGCLRWGTKERVEVGKEIKVSEPLELCVRGLHASTNILDALNYAPGPVLCRVILSGEMLTSTDKIVASRRTVIAMADADELLNNFAKACVLSYLNLCEPPEALCEFLRRGEGKRATSWDAAWAASWDAEKEASWAAAWDAEKEASWTVACDAEKEASWTAACDAAKEEKEEALSEAAFELLGLDRE